MVFMRRHGPKPKVGRSCKGAAISLDGGSGVLERRPVGSAVDVLSDKQADELCSAIERLTPGSIAAAYARWKMPFNDFVGEFDWLLLTRDLLRIPEDRLEDE